MPVHGTIIPLNGIIWKAEYETYMGQYGHVPMLLGKNQGDIAHQGYPKLLGEWEVPS